MAVDNVTIYTGMSLIFIYAIVYRTNKFIGSLLFAIMGIAIMALTPYGTTSDIAGGMILMGGLISLAYSWAEIKSS